MKTKYFLPVLFILLFSLIITASSPKTFTIQGRLEQKNQLATFLHSNGVVNAW